MHHIHSDDAAIESQIQAAGKTAPRITPADVEASIDSCWYFTAAEGADGAASTGTPYAEQPPVPAQHPLRLLTFCVLVLKNGFTVTGESAYASPENFDAKIGRDVARQNAVSKIWPLLGYQLKDSLHRRDQLGAHIEMVKASGFVPSDESGQQTAEAVRKQQDTAAYQTILNGDTSSSGAQENPTASDPA